jgi:hypothetical protein
MSPFRRGTSGRWGSFVAVRDAAFFFAAGWRRGGDTGQPAALGVSASGPDRGALFFPPRLGTWLPGFQGNMLLLPFMATVRPGHNLGYFLKQEIATASTGS